MANDDQALLRRRESRRLATAGGAGRHHHQPARGRQRGADADPANPTEATPMNRTPRYPLAQRLLRRVWQWTVVLVVALPFAVAALFYLG